MNLSNEYSAFIAIVETPIHNDTITTKISHIFISQCSIIDGQFMFFFCQSNSPFKSGFIYLFISISTGFYRLKFENSESW
jgi:hypothetical protein